METVDGDRNAALEIMVATPAIKKNNKRRKNSSNRIFYPNWK